MLVAFINKLYRPSVCSRNKEKKKTQCDAHVTTNLRILKSAAVFGLVITSLPTSGGVGSERRTDEGLPGRREVFEGGDGE